MKSRKPRNRHRPSPASGHGPAPRSVQQPATGENTIQINGHSYRVLEQLSSLPRGRWKIWESIPQPDGTYYTLMDLKDDNDSRQLLDCVKSLPRHAIGIPHLRNCETTENRLRMVVEWCDGIDLKSYLDRFAPGGKYLPIGAYEAIRRMRSLAQCCCILHQDCRIVHGDLKPANLILPRERIPIFLIDFGSSWQIEKTRGRCEGDGCDEHYSAPEVFRNDAVIDGRADQFSIGVILFRMLTGSLPYENLGGYAGHSDCNFDGRLERVSEISPQVSCLPADLPSRIDSLLERALSLEPANRYGTMRAFTDALSQIFEQIKNESHKPKLQPQPKVKTSSAISFFGRLFGKDC